MTVMRIYLSPPDVGDLERSYVDRAVAGGWVAPAGPDLSAFEDEISCFVGGPRAVALSSGTAALHLGLLSLGVKPGDEVICSTFTFAASVNAIVYCGARPSFVDSESSSWNMSPALLEQRLDHCRQSGIRVGAVLVVDLYGQCADFDLIADICRRNGVPIVEDAAEALGATYKGRPAGTLGDVGVYSFNGNKILTTGGGGMLVTANEATADRVRHLSTQARQPVSHYEHLEVGYNYRLSNILAAIGRAQLRRFPQMLTRRLKINELYRECLSDVEEMDFMPIPNWSGWNGWLTCLVFSDDRVSPRVQEALMSRGIECRPLWKPMHQQPAFSSVAATLDGTSDRLYRLGLCLPSGSGLSDSQVQEVAEVVRSHVRLRRRQ